MVTQRRFDSKSGNSIKFTCMYYILLFFNSLSVEWFKKQRNSYDSSK